VAAYVIVNTTRLSGRNYTTSRDVTGAVAFVEEHQHSRRIYAYRSLVKNWSSSC
jgi:hypothetical protein